MNVKTIALLACLALGDAAAGQTLLSFGPAGSYEVSMVPWQKGYALAWYDTRDGNPEIYFKRIDAKGGTEVPETRLTNSPGKSYEPSLAATAKGLGVAWYEIPGNDKGHSGTGGHVMFALVNAEGHLRAERQLSSPGSAARNPVVLADQDEYCVAWIEGTKAPRVRARRFSSEGDPIGGPVDLGFASKKTWNLNGGIHRGKVYLVLDAGGEHREKELYLIGANRDLKNARQVRLTADDGFESVYPDIAFLESKARLVWWDRRDGNAEVYTGLLDLGSFELEQQRLTWSEGESIGAYLAPLQNGWAIAFNDDSSGNHEIYLAEIGDQGTVGIQRVTQARLGSRIPAVVVVDNKVALAWNDFREAKGPRDFSRSQIYFHLAPRGVGHSMPSELLGLVPVE